MAKEAQSHLFIRPSEDDGDAHQNVTTDAETETQKSPGQQRDDEDKSEHGKVNKWLHRDQTYTRWSLDGLHTGCT